MTPRADEAKSCKHAGPPPGMTAYVAFLHLEDAATSYVACESKIAYTIFARRSDAQKGSWCFRIRCISKINTVHWRIKHVARRGRLVP